MFRSDELRMKARRWRDEAARAYDARDRKALLELAAAYDRLADHADGAGAAGPPHEHGR